MSEVRRGTVLSFSAAAWTALVLLDGADSETQMPVGQWVTAETMVATAEVACLVFGGTNTDDGIVLGPYGAVGLQNLGIADIPTFGGLNLGAATGAGTGDLLASGRIETAHGTWTATFKGSGTAGTFTYANQGGTYLKIGKLVFIQCRISISAISVAPTLTMTIEGLPFAADNTYPVTFGQINQYNYATSSVQLVAFISSGTTSIFLREAVDNGAIHTVVGADFTNAGCDLVFSCVYQIP